MKYIDLRIATDCEEDLWSFVRLCSIIQGAGEAGEGRNIKVFVDGDGSGRFSFYQILAGGENLKLPSSPAPEKTVWLGE